MPGLRARDFHTARCELGKWTQTFLGWPLHSLTKSMKPFSSNVWHSRRERTRALERKGGTPSRWRDRQPTEKQARRGREKPAQRQPQRQRLVRQLPGGLPAGQRFQ